MNDEAGHQVANAQDRTVTGALTFRAAVAEAKRLNETTPGHYVVNLEGEVDWLAR